MANILIYSNNPQLTAQWTHALIAEYNVSMLHSIRGEYTADAVIFDAKKLDDDASLLTVFANKKVRFLVMGCDWPEHKQIEVLINGAAGYCEQSEASELLTRAVACILAGDIWIRRALVPKVIGVLTSARRPQLAPNTVDTELKLKQLASLSAREVEVADMIRQGESNKRIAFAMNISERTVKAHLSSIFRKLNVDDRLRLALLLKEIDQYQRGML
ncbi:response regulator transcription factor [Methylomonas sp. OY6]|uniref:Response regulator transcription factor n=1 Tax=Methylomonas defluvii TaxID=3045149 RepID=A0ABU4UDN3_9GAMM|nr:MULTISPECIES: response regulator transcription factor [unclassified Methylomonas]MDX8127286.1 response regulator transcription factor [Methylomonas sp. OY6]